MSRLRTLAATAPGGSGAGTPARASPPVPGSPVGTPTRSGRREDAGQDRPPRALGRSHRRGRLRRGARATRRPVPAVLGEVVGALRAGAPPQRAWARVGVPTGVEGYPRAEDLAGVLAPDVARVVAAACRVSAELGAPAAALLDQVAVSAAREDQARAARAAALAGPRATSRLLGWLPVVGLGVGWLLGAEPLAVLLDGAAGSGLLALAALLAAVGHAWTRREVATARAAGTDPTDPAGAVGTFDLLAAGLACGASVPRVLTCVGAALGGTAGAGLVRVGRLLVLGAGWAEAWAPVDGLEAVQEALAPAWREGIAPGPLLHAAGEGHRRAVDEAAAQAAGRLGTRVVLPLGLCHLPAFVLVGVVPVMVSTASGALG